MNFGCVRIKQTSIGIYVDYWIEFVQFKTKDEFKVQRIKFDLKGKQYINQLELDDYVDKVNESLEQNEIESIDQLDDGFKQLLQLTVFKDF